MVNIREKASITLKGMTYESEEYGFVLHWEGQHRGILILENEWDVNGVLMNNSQVVEFEDEEGLPEIGTSERDDLEDFILNSIKDDWKKDGVK